MNYFEGLFDIDSDIAEVEDSIMKQRYQMEQLHELLCDIDEVDQAEKALRATQAVMPLMIAFDYFLKIEKLAKKIDSACQRAFEDVPEIRARLDRQNNMETVREMSDKELDLAVRMWRLSGKSIESGRL